MLLSRIVEVRDRFARSANVERDLGSDAISGYLPTARTLDVVDRIARSLLSASSGRAISITGPYGSGKSSLALFLDGLLAPKGERSRDLAHAILAEADPNLSRAFSAALGVMSAADTGFIRAV